MIAINIKLTLRSSFCELHSLFVGRHNNKMFIFVPILYNLYFSYYISLYKLLLLQILIELLKIILLCHFSKFNVNSSLIIVIKDMKSLILIILELVTKHSLVRNTVWIGNKKSSWIANYPIDLYDNLTGNR